MGSGSSKNSTKNTKETVKSSKIKPQNIHFEKESREFESNGELIEPVKNNSNDTYNRAEQITTVEDIENIIHVAVCIIV
jgi:hypothetical protein